MRVVITLWKPVRKGDYLDFTIPLNSNCQLEKKTETTYWSYYNKVRI